VVEEIEDSFRNDQMLLVYISPQTNTGERGLESVGGHLWSRGGSHADCSL